jgi:phenylalanyl-tRNA synthetase beta chain
MLELGQPLHAFDFEKIKTRNAKRETRNEIIVRRAKKNEEMELLDEKKLKLKDTDLLITNGETPLALAGIMGGRDSGIGENTKTIVLEAASFDAINIRRSRSRLNVRTESSDRFEKDIDPNLTEKAMVRLIEILEHTAGAKLEGITDDYPNKIKPWKIKLDLNYLNNLLGEKILQKEVMKILNLLGIYTKCKIPNTKYLECEIPTYRVDLQTQEDLIEEVGRIWGYDKIEIQPIAELDGVSAKVNEQLLFEKNIKKFLANTGYDEMYNYSFYSAKDVSNCALNAKAHLELANPMNPDQQFVRTSLIPGILKNIKTNLKHFESFNLFEIGKVYYDNKNIEERRILVIAKVLGKDKGAETFYSLKGEVENLLENFGISKGSTFGTPKVEPLDVFHLSRSAEIIINGKSVGYIGEINPIVLGNYKIEKRVAFCDIDTEKLLSALPKEKIFESISKFPTVDRDISMIVPSGVLYAQISKLVQKAGGELVESVKLFDYFAPKNSLAIRISLGDASRTLENIEVDEVIGKIVSNLEKELKVEVRK